ncbi:hypothetical protein ANANG_G00227470 [Anguilla anguilla]|uniref:Kazal-like domain-containing protein n=1 Tax=Anguilla anguilla TaxID=7936 RepID=A0A9D3LXI9_ANGAN|nr:hypothetical protein ANANG_G00227470 [Anguilla anguilla]
MPFKPLVLPPVPPGPEAKVSCEEMECQFGASCVEANGHAHCECPSPDCGEENKTKVCGSDGVTYADRCQLLTIACRQDKLISVKHQGQCTETILHPGAATRPTPPQKTPPAPHPPPPTSRSPCPARATPPRPALGRGRRTRGRGTPCPPPPGWRACRPWGSRRNPATLPSPPTATPPTTTNRLAPHPVFDPRPPAGCPRPPVRGLGSGERAQRRRRRGG